MDTENEAMKILWGNVTRVRNPQATNTQQKNSFPCRKWCSLVCPQWWHVYVCTYVRVCMWISVCTSVCIVELCAWVSVCVSVYMCLYVSISACVCTYVCMCVSVYKHMHMCAHMCFHILPTRCSLHISGLSVTRFPWDDPSVSTEAEIGYQSASLLSGLKYYHFMLIQVFGSGP